MRTGYPLTRLNYAKSLSECAQAPLSNRNGYQNVRRPKPTPSVLELRPPLEGRRPSPGSLGSLLVGPETDLDFFFIEDFFASIVIFSQEAS